MPSPTKEEKERMRIDMIKERRRQVNSIILSNRQTDITEHLRAYDTITWTGD